MENGNGIPAESSGQSQLHFLAAAQGSLLQMRELLTSKALPSNVAPMGDIADTARQLALQADAIGFLQISAAADAVEHTADQAQSRPRLVRPELALRLKEQLAALEEQIKDDLVVCETT